MSTRLDVPDLNYVRGALAPDFAWTADSLVRVLWFVQRELEALNEGAPEPPSGLTREQLVALEDVVRTVDKSRAACARARDLLGFTYPAR